jgi:hypothetical protein
MGTFVRDCSRLIQSGVGLAALQSEDAQVRNLRYIGGRCIRENSQLYLFWFIQ